MTREESLNVKLTEGLAPAHLAVTNESSMHNVPPGSETHFRVLVVTDAFSSRSKVARHRMIHRLLGDDLESGLHALAIDALTPAEWQERDERASVSPKCLGGSG